MRSDYKAGIFHLGIKPKILLAHDRKGNKELIRLNLNLFQVYDRKHAPLDVSRIERSSQ